MFENIHNKMKVNSMCQKYYIKNYLVKITIELLSNLQLLQKNTINIQYWYAENLHFRNKM